MKKILALLLIMTLLSVNLVFAEGNDVLRPQRSNLVIEKSTDSEMIYTYTENGIELKCIENITPIDITTKIYQYNIKSSQFELQESYVTNIKKITQEFTTQNTNINSNTFTNTYTDPSTLSYVYYFTNSGDNYVASKSLAIAKTLFMAAFPNVASAVAYRIAADIFELKLDYVWYTSVVYIESGVDPDAPGAKWHKESQVFYSDSRRRSIDIIGNDTFYYQWGW